VYIRSPSSMTVASIAFCACFFLSFASISYIKFCGLVQCDHAGDLNWRLAVIEETPTIIIHLLFFSMEAVRYCQMCNCPILGGPLLAQYCTRCQPSVCQHHGLAPYAGDLKRGELVTCPDCRNEVVPILCPFGSCAKVYFVNRGYRMGDLCQCIHC
jgi:hypothetical protein